MVEIKFQHMPEAWWQLRKLYQPALEFKLRRPVFVLEVCKSYDPAMPFPEPIELVENLWEFCNAPRKVFGVFQWKP